MKQPILEHLKSDLQPVKPLRPAWQYCAAAVLAAALLVLTGTQLVGTLGWREIGAHSWAFLGAGLLLALCSSAWTASQWLSPTGKASLGKTGAGFLLAVLGLFSAAEAGVFSVPLAAVCFSLGSALSLPSALICYLLFRRAAPQRREQVALASGIFLGLLGFLMIQIHCPIRDLGHLLTGHALLPIFWGLAAYSIVRLLWRA